MENMIKTKKDWHGTLEEYLITGDEVDEELYYYFLEVLPPAYMSRGVFQVGEPYSHNEENKPLYDTFQEVAGRYYYRGHMTTAEAKKL